MSKTKHGALRRAGHDDDLIERWKVVLDRHGNCQAEILKRLTALGFEELSRSTISRWLSGEGRRGRAADALRLLERQAVSGSLVIAEPATILALPSTLACKPYKFRSDNDDRGLRGPKVRGRVKTKEISRLQREYDVTVDWQSVVTGGEALRLLSEGRADLAIAASVLVQEGLPSGCQRLATISQAPLYGFSMRKIEMARQLEECWIGMPRNASVPYLLKELRAQRGIEVRVQRCEDFPGPVEMATAFRAGKIDTVIGWDTYVADVRDQLPPRLRQRALPMPEGLLGYLSQDLIVNTVRANAAAVRAYLQCVLKTTAEINKNKQSPSYLETIAEQFVIRVDAETLSRTDFYFRDVDLSLLVDLWRREVTEPCA